MPDEISAAPPDAVPGEPPPGDQQEPPPAVPEPPRRRRQRIALIATAAVVALAAAVAALALTASPADPYALPPNVCALVSPATLAKYVPGRPHGKKTAQNCIWVAGEGCGLVVYASVLNTAAQARTSFPQLIQRTKQVDTTKTTAVTGLRAVGGLGDQATAMFDTAASPDHPGKRDNGVYLFILSRNAIFQVIRYGGDSGAVRPSGPALLPGAIAIAREVMAATPLLGPSSPGVGVHISLDVSYPVGGAVILGDPGRGGQHQGVAE